MRRDRETPAHLIPWLSSSPAHPTLRLTCGGCGRHVEVAKADLIARYGDMTLADLRERMTCTCGHRGGSTTLLHDHHPGM